MALSDIKAAPGNWLVSNCADFPSEKNCQVIIMGPADQREDFTAAAAAHMVQSHGHQDSPKLREDLEKIIRPVTL